MYSQFAVITLMITAVVALSADENREEKLAYTEAQVSSLSEAAGEQTVELANAGMKIRDEAYDGRAAAIAYDSELSGSSGGGGGGGITASGSGYYYGAAEDYGVPSDQELVSMGLSLRQWEQLTPQQRSDAKAGARRGSAAMRRQQALASAARAGATTSADAPD